MKPEWWNGTLGPRTLPLSSLPRPLPPVGIVNCPALPLPALLPGHLPTISLVYLTLTHTTLPALQFPAGPLPQP